MLFNAHIFIFLFLPAMLVSYYLLAKINVNFSKILLVAGSIFFYGWWEIIYVPILIGSIIVNFTIGNYLSKYSNKLILASGIVLNIALLGYFKYTDFFLTNVNYLTGNSYEMLSLVLPLGISFFTFQQIAYLVDTYRKEVEEHSFINYSIFVSFFPQLIAGPIVHHKEMMPQFADMKNSIVNYSNLFSGTFIFILGLFKKVVIADNLGKIANQGFDEAIMLPMLDAWLTSLSYTFQLYFDFSGYSDMAIGLALMFNIKIPQNFNSPYKATSIRDFWRRWHMTLSRFLKDYIYISLGGNRTGNIKIYINVLVTFFIAGLWHGAGWLFVIWGLLHGAAIVLQRIWERFNILLPVWLGWFITFNFINVTWVIFRANSWDDAIKVLSGMVGFSGTYVSSNSIFLNIEMIYAIPAVVASLLIVLIFRNSYEQLQEIEMTYKVVALLNVLFLLSFLMLGNKQEFLYFNF